MANKLHLRVQPIKPVNGPTLNGPKLGVQGQTKNLVLAENPLVVDCSTHPLLTPTMFSFASSLVQPA